ncbi:MAG: STAS domain-containing protein [SAR324 cluster bacterium]|nr:STAS domain-containing protein [SAR324 cluster bacterium]
MRLNATPDGFVMEGTATLSDAPLLASELRHALGSKLDCIVVDTAMLNEVDTAILQVMVSARITARNRGKELLVLPMSDAFRLAMEALGLDTFLGEQGLHG